MQEHLELVIADVQGRSVSQIGSDVRQVQERLELVIADAQGRSVSQIGSDVRQVQERLELGLSDAQLARLMPRLRRNFLPNDNAVAQKQLAETWKAARVSPCAYRDLLESGFRVFSQNDEDGILLRIFSHIGVTNQYVIEIGSNCSDSDVGIPENLSTNLIVNHGWHSLIVEVDPDECQRMRYFFARDFSTKHFHILFNDCNGYFSPIIAQQEINSENIDQVLLGFHDESEPDLMVIDIDGGDFEVIRAMKSVRPRVLVVEFEKRFGYRHCVVQFDKSEFSARWPQSGAASLAAWDKLLNSRGYTLCAVGTCGFNAFYVRSDMAGRFLGVSLEQAFKEHPILSKVPEEFWILPDNSWETV